MEFNGMFLLVKDSYPSFNALQEWKSQLRKLFAHSRKYSLVRLCIWECYARREEKNSIHIPKSTTRILSRRDLRISKYRNENRVERNFFFFSIFPGECLLKFAVCVWNWDTSQEQNVKHLTEPIIVEHWVSWLFSTFTEYDKSFSVL